MQLLPSEAIADYYNNIAVPLGDLGHTGYILGYLGDSDVSRMGG